MRTIIIAGTVGLGCLAGIAFPILPTTSVVAESGVVQETGPLVVSGYAPKVLPRDPFTVYAPPTLTPVEGPWGPVDPDGWRGHKVSVTPPPRDTSGVCPVWEGRS